MFFHSFSLLFFLTLIHSFFYSFFRTSFLILIFWYFLLSIFFLSFFNYHFFLFFSFLSFIRSIFPPFFAVSNLHFYSLFQYFFLFIYTCPISFVLYHVSFLLCTYFSSFSLFDSLFVHLFFNFPSLFSFSCYTCLKRIVCLILSLPCICTSSLIKMLSKQFRFTLYSVKPSLSESAKSCIQNRSLYIFELYKNQIRSSSKFTKRDSGLWQRNVF